MPLFETVITATIADLPQLPGSVGLIATVLVQFLMFETADCIETGPSRCTYPCGRVGHCTGSNKFGFEMFREWRRQRRQALFQDPV